MVDCTALLQLLLLLYCGALIASSSSGTEVNLSELLVILVTT